MVFPNFDYTPQPKKPADPVVRALWTLVAVVTLLGGCAVINTTSTDTPTTDDVQTAPDTTPEDPFLADIYNEAPDVYELHTHEELRELGRLTCQIFDGGGNVWDLMAEIERSSTPGLSEQYKKVIGAAVQFRCPEHLSTVADQIDAGSTA